MKQIAYRLALGVALLAAGCGGTKHTSFPNGSADRGITELKSIGQLRDAFNAHQGIPRLIVLISPT
jgi:hypothetical protein